MYIIQKQLVKACRGGEIQKEILNNIDICNLAFVIKDAFILTVD